MALTAILRQIDVDTLTIANGATTSDACSSAGYAIFGLVMPSAFTGASVTFTVSHDGTTYQALHDTTNTQVSLTVTASKSYDLPTALASWPSFKIVSASSEGAARTLQIVKKG